MGVTGAPRVEYWSGAWRIVRSGPGRAPEFVQGAEVSVASKRVTLRWTGDAARAMAFPSLAAADFYLGLKPAGSQA